MASFAMPQGVTVEEMLEAMGAPVTEPAPAAEPAAEAKPAATRTRARATGGKFKADDPATPDKDEAWQEN